MEIIDKITKHLEHKKEEMNFKDFYNYVEGFIRSAILFNNIDLEVYKNLYNKYQSEYYNLVLNEKEEAEREFREEFK